MNRLAVSAVFLAAFGFLLSSAHPAFQLDDSPETAAAAASISVQHAPGYPLTTLAGRLALVLPAGGPYFRLNAFSCALVAALAAALAAAVPVLASCRGSAFAGAVAGLTFAFLPQAWENGVSARGTIYSPTLLLLALAMALSLKGRARGGPRLAALAATAFGAALAGHWMTAACFLPVLVWLAPPQSTREWALRGFLACLGLSLYLQLPLSAGREPCWGDPGTFGGLIDILARRSFTPQVAIRPPGLLPLQLLYGALTPLREGGPAFLLLAWAGATALWKRRRDSAAALATGCATLVVAVALATNPVHVINGDLVLWLLDRFYLPLLAAGALAAGAGVALLASGLPRPAGVVSLAAFAALPAFLLSADLRDRDHSRDFSGHDIAANFSGDIPAPSAVMVEEDYQSFPLMALFAVDGRAEGRTLVVTNPFLRRAWGWRRLAGSLPAAAGASRARGVNWDERVVLLADALQASAPVFHLPMCSNPFLLRRLEYRGLVFGFLPEGARPAPPSRRSVGGRFRRYRLRGLLAERPLRDPAALSVLDAYALARAAPAAGAMARRDPAEALAILREALPWPGHFGRAMLLMSAGRLLAEAGRYPDAEAVFRKACRIRPYDPDCVANLATARAAQGGMARNAAAMAALQWVLRRHPGHAMARANLASLNARLANIRRGTPIRGVAPLPER